MKTLNLASKLISIPSFVDTDNDESVIGKYIYDYVKSNTNLVIKKQRVEKNRFNIIAYSKSCQGKNLKLNIDLMLIDHIDTVQPKIGWKTNQFNPTIIGNKLYGLGAADTKSNVAILLKLAEKISSQKIMFLFYVDEEYDFKGVKKFINKYKNKLKIKNIISTDGENLNIRNACRGLIELDLVCQGKSGHSADPLNGINVIKNFNNLIVSLEKYLFKLKDNLGTPTLNISYINGGLLLNDIGKILLGKNGNNIPDYLEATIEIRTNTKLDLQKLNKQLKTLSKINRISLDIKKIRHNLASWFTNPADLSKLIKKINLSGITTKFTDAGKSGYVDIALLNKQFNCPCCCIGVIGGNRHGVNEWAQINSIYKLKQILESMIIG